MEGFRGVGPPASLALQPGPGLTLAEEAQRIWELLRQQSNVELARLELEGTGTRRRVKLDVTVDGVGGAALGVMSQGELHSLALSLFLPRAMLPESPFRFIMIDDPIQSMDPARVDGLARVLEEVGRQRQLVVFTHDDRLPERSFPPRWPHGWFRGSAAAPLRLPPRR